MNHDFYDAPRVSLEARGEARSVLYSCTTALRSCLFLHDSFFVAVMNKFPKQHVSEFLPSTFFSTDNTEVAVSESAQRP